MISVQEYTGSLIEKLSENFDISRDFEISPFIFDYHAQLNIKNSKFAVVKEVKIYEFENNEHLIIKFNSIFDTKDIKNEISSIESNLKEIVKPHSEHMSSQILLVHICESEIPEDLEKLASRYKFQKGFAFGFKGWADLALVVVSLKENRVITHKKFIKTASFFLPEKDLERSNT